MKQIKQASDITTTSSADSIISEPQMWAFEVFYGSRRQLPAMSVASLSVFLKALGTLREISSDMAICEGKGSVCRGCSAPLPNGLTRTVYL